MCLNKEMSSTLPITPEVNSDIIRFKTIESKLSENHHLMSRKTDFLLCPICQEGNLNTYERGKILGIIPDKWLICSKCAAEFDKKFNKAQLVKVINDPFDIFKQFALQTLPITKWQDIAFQRIKSENNDLGEELLVLKTKLLQFVTNELIEGKFRALCINVNSFILKKDENPLFATVAVILEERKGRITERTTFGGGRRNYSGFSFRVAKGLYYHAGASTATPRQTTVQTTEYTELVNVDMGELLVTNHRILFKGKSRGLVIPISKIVAIDIDTENDALMIIQENKKPSILKLAKDLNMELNGIKFDLPVSLDYIVSLINPTLCEQSIKVPSKPIITGNKNYKNHIAPEYNNRVEKLKKSFSAAYNFLKYPERNHTAIYLKTSVNAHLYLKNYYLSYIIIGDDEITFRAKFNNMIAGETTDESNLLFSGALQKLIDSFDGKKYGWAVDFGDKIIIKKSAPDLFFNSLISFIEGLK